VTQGAPLALEYASTIVPSNTAPYKHLSTRTLAISPCCKNPSNQQRHLQSFFSTLPLCHYCYHHTKHYLAAARHHLNGSTQSTPPHPVFQAAAAPGSPCFPAPVAASSCGLRLPGSSQRQQLPAVEGQRGGPGERCGASRGDPGHHLTRTRSQRG
jgi:hypothetical protein